MSATWMKRGETRRDEEGSTFKEIVELYYWPRMDVDVHEHVRRCKFCELAKGTKPSRQGFLQGWRHSDVMQCITMDLVGPLGSVKTGHIHHTAPLYILVITDPFSRGGRYVLSWYNR